MAAFDRYYTPGVSVGDGGADSDLGFGEPPYDGDVENEWANAGTNTRLQFIDGSTVSWNTVALGTTSRRLDCSGWIAESGGAAMSSDVPANLTVSAIYLGIDGEADISSVDATSASLFAGLRQQSSGGVFTPPDGSGLTQFFFDSLITNELSGAGTYPFSQEFSTTDALGGLSAANLLTVLRSSTMVLRSWFINDTSGVFTAYIDRIRLRVVGTVPDSPSASTTFRDRTSRPLGFSRTSR
jgi:hypothetical protein